jgi:hypothetical protein
MPIDNGKLYEMRVSGDWSDKPDKKREIEKEYLTIKDKLKDLLPEGRNKSICITNLETSCLWAMKAIDDNGE